jgi:hypothetical protein
MEGVFPSTIGAYNLREINLERNRFSGKLSELIIRINHY